MKFNLTNASIAVAVFLAFLLGYRCSFVWNEYGISHFLYPFSHVNVFHLLANLVALLSFRKNVGAVAYIAAVAASFLPMGDTATMGLSAVLFAHIGATWAYSAGFYPMCRRILPFAVLIGLLPGVNFFIHIYSLFLGYIIMYSVYHLLKLKFL